MSDDLDTTDSVTSFVSAHTMGWHQLGQLLQSSFTAEQAMKEGKLGGWNTRKVPLYADADGKRVLVRERVAVVRDNPVRKGQVDHIGIVSPSYQIIQNEEHAALLDALVDESGAHFDTAGAIAGGRRVFITMKLPGHINVGGVDPVENYIAAINSHDGTFKFSIMITPIRIVCQNTLNLAFQNHSHIFQVRHTSGALKSIHSLAREALDLSFNYLDGFQEEAERLINTTMTEAQFEAIIQEEFGAPEGAAAAAATRATRKVEQMIDLFSEADTQAGIRNTAWAGLNAMTEWYDHFSPVRGDERDVTRAQKAVFDPGFKNRALELMTAAVR